jgi:hypothetical protein
MDKDLKYRDGAGKWNIFLLNKYIDEMEQKSRALQTPSF